MVFKDLQIRITCTISMKMSLPYYIFNISSYSEAYNSYNFCDRRKLFAVLNLHVNRLLWSWYCDLKNAFKVHQMNVFKVHQMNVLT